MVVPSVKPPSKQDRPIVNCLYCDYSCKGKQALGRHIHYAHPEKKKNNTPVEVTPSTLKELVNLTAQLAAKQGDELAKAVKEVREESITLRLKLLAVAINKADRTVQIASLLRDLDNVLFRKLKLRIVQDPDGTGFSTDELVQLRKALSGDISDDVAFLKSVLAIRDAGDDTFFERVTELLQHTSGVDGQVIAGRERIVEMIKIGPGDDVAGGDRDFARSLMGMFDKRIKTVAASRASVESTERFPVIDGKVVENAGSNTG